MKSIITPHKKICFICGRTVGLQLHHVWHGTSNRKKSDEDGLTVWLCVDDHIALHDKGIFDKELMKVGQQAWENEYGEREDFIKRYGKSVL